MIVGCYTLHLYCECAECVSDAGKRQMIPAEFTGETYDQCKNTAIKNGWKFRDKGTRVFAPGHKATP